MPNEKVTDRDYLYLSALLRAREARMLTGDAVERMIDAPGFDEAAKLLSECGYADMSGFGAPQVEAALSQRRTQVFEELDNIVPEKEIVDMFRMRFDYHNAKALIKAEGAETDGEHLLSDSGRFAPDALAQAYRSEDFRDFPDEFKNAVIEAKSVLGRTESPQLADFVLDRAYFAELSAAAERISSPFVKSYVAMLADSANLNACVRARRMGRDADFLKKALVPGGSRDTEALAEAAMTGEGLEAAFKDTAFKEAAAKGAKAVGSGSLTEFERACDNAVASLLADSGYVGFGAETVVAYLAHLESEITAARMILTGRLFGVKPEKLRERLRDAYV